MIRFAARRVAVLFDAFLKWASKVNARRWT